MLGTAEAACRVYFLHYAYKNTVIELIKTRSLSVVEMTKMYKNKTILNS